MFNGSESLTVDQQKKMALPTAAERSKLDEALGDLIEYVTINSPAKGVLAT